MTRSTPPSRPAAARPLARVRVLLRPWLVAGTALPLVALPLALSSVGCGKEQAAAGPMMARPAPPVTVTAAVARDVPNYLDEIGSCAAVENVSIMPQVTGQISDIKFKDGADLTVGQLLFTIDDRPFTNAQHQAEAAVAQAQASIVQAKAAVDFAKIDQARSEGLVKSHAVAQSDLDTKNNALQAADAQLQAANAQLQSALATVEIAKLNVEYCQIKSPLPGRAGKRLVDKGNVVKANEAALLSVQRMDSIYADFTVNENQLLAVRQEMAQGTLKTLVKLPDDKDFRDGELTFLDNSVQDGSGTVKLRATLKNEDKHFWPSQFVDVRLVLRVQKGAVLVPTSVPQQSQKGSYALVVKDGTGPDGKSAQIAEMRPVKLGQRHGDMIVLESGVSAGDQVITDGQMMVQPGLPVKVLPPPPPLKEQEPSQPPGKGAKLPEASAGGK